MHSYENPQCFSIGEFEEDLARFTYLKKQLYRYLSNKELNDRIILNHLIILFNVFGNMTIKFLFFKMERELWNILATFLVFLNRMPDIIQEVNMRSYDFTLDEYVINRLRNI